MWSPEDMESGGNVFVGILLAFVVYLPACWLAVAIRFWNVRSSWSLFISRCNRLAARLAPAAPFVVIFALIPAAIVNLAFAAFLHLTNGWDFINTNGSVATLILGWLAAIAWLITRITESDFTDTSNG